jgi:hypothetical protein
MATMNFYVLDHRHPTSGYVNGEVVYTPSLGGKYVRELTEIPKDLTTEVNLNAEIRSTKLDFFSAAEAFFVSEALAEVICRYDDKVSMRPAVVRFGNGALTEKTYFFIAATDRVRCFDFENSEYPGKALALSLRAEGKVRRINAVQKLVIHEAGTAQRGYFFIDPDVAVMNPLISEAVVDEARAKKLNIVPVPLSDWSSSLQRANLPRRY